MLTQVIQISLKFLLGKETSEKKTNKNFETKMNSVSKFDYYIKNSARLRTFGILASAALVAIMTLTAFPITKITQVAEAAPGTATAATTVLNMTSSASANLNLVVKSSDGTFAASSENDLAKFGITTNNFTGYTLSITGPENNDLTNDNTEKVFTSIDHILDTQSFTNGSGDLYNGKYGYFPSKYNSTVNTYFRPAPTETATTLDVTSEANNESNNYTIGLGARADYDTPNGTYSNTFTLNLVGNPVSYAITYADNSGDDTVTPTLPAPTTGETSNTFIPITTNKPTRTNYTFTGWCNKPTTLNSEGETVCPEDGVAYSSGENYEIDQTTSNITTLYTIWTINKYTLTINFAGSGVNNVKVCTTTGDCTGEDLIATIVASGNKVENLISGHSVYLYPTFNNNYEFSSWENSGSYGTLSCTASNTCSSDQNPSFTVGGGDGFVTVTGMASMPALQNVTVSACTTTAQQVIDNRDGQIYTIQRLADGNCWMLDNLRLGAVDLREQLSTSNTNMDSNTSFALPASISSGFNSYTEAMINTDYANITTTSYGIGSGKIGTYYNYCAATAGTYCMSSDSGSGNASYDICPSGWRMPTGYSAGEYEALYEAYGSNVANFLKALSTPLSGEFNGGSDVYQGSYGHFWASTRRNVYAMSYLSVSSSDVYLTSGSYRTYGYSVRCVLKPPLERIATMQEIGALSASEKTTLLAETFTGVAYDIVDSRDGQVYKISKLADGKLWLLDNLRLGATDITTDLTSANTNFSGRISASAWNSYRATNNFTSYTAPMFNSEYSDTTVTNKYGSGSGKIGVYYNYCAASVGTYCMDSSSGSGNSSNDICPAGWRMPTGGSSGEYKALYAAYSNNVNNFRRALSTAITGYFYNETATYQNRSSSFWSSTYWGTDNMYNLIVTPSSGSNTVYPEGSYGLYSGRSTGGSVRCVLE